MTDDPHRDPTPAEQAECRRALEEFSHHRPGRRLARPEVLSMTWTDASLLRHAEFVLAGVLRDLTNDEWRSAYSWADALHADIVAHHAAFDAHGNEQEGEENKR